MCSLWLESKKDSPIDWKSVYSVKQTNKIKMTDYLVMQLRKGNCGSAVAECSSLK